MKTETASTISSVLYLNNSEFNNLLESGEFDIYYTEVDNNKEVILESMLICLSSESFKAKLAEMRTLDEEELLKIPCDMELIHRLMLPDITSSARQKNQSEAFEREEKKLRSKTYEDEYLLRLPDVAADLQIDVNYLENYLNLDECTLEWERFDEKPGVFLSWLITWLHTGHGRMKLNQWQKKMRLEAFKKYRFKFAKLNMENHDDEDW